MKNFKIILVALVIVATATMVSCKDGKTETTKEVEVENATEVKTEIAEKMGAEYTSAYVCPMHCEGSGSDMKGNCPTCGMDYVENEDHMSNGHKHE